jgi:cholesterol oxidase
MVYDFIIIGSGFGGSVAALRLKEKGYSVLVIEKGKRYTGNDFARSNWNLRKYLWFPPLACFGIQKLSFYKRASILSGVGVGGGSLVYACTLFTPPDDYFTSSEWAGFRDWKKTLMPFYRVAGQMLGKTTYHQMNREDRLLYQVSRQFGCEDTFSNVDVGVYFGDTEKQTDPYFNGHGPPRKGCRECAGCMVGCRENAKNSLDKNYLYFAEKFGARILAEHRAYRIEYKEGTYHIHTRSSTSLLHRSKQVFTSRQLVVSGGTLGSLELLLKQKHRYRTLPALSEMLGEKLRTNSETLNAVSGIREKMNNGLAITSVINPDKSTHIEIVKYPDRSNALRWFFTLSASGAKHPGGRILKLLGKIITHPVTFIEMVFNVRWSGGLVIFLVMQHIDNYMKMAWKKGMFRSRMVIENTSDKPVPAFISIGQQVMESYAKMSGGIPQNIILEILFNRPTTAHILGGCSMSPTRETGVIDDGFRVHGYPGMYILDGSSVQGNPGVNPSLSILANAEYAMSLVRAKPGAQTTELAAYLQGRYPQEVLQQQEPLSTNR